MYVYVDVHFFTQRVTKKLICFNKNQAVLNPGFSSTNNNNLYVFMFIF